MVCQKEEAHQELRESYLIHEEKIELLQRIVDCQLAVVPDLYRLKEEVSIYIGICSAQRNVHIVHSPAYAINGRQGSVDSFLGGLHYEVREIGKFLKRKRCKSYDDLLRRRYTYKYYSRRDGYAV